MRGEKLVSYVNMTLVSYADSSIEREGGAISTGRGKSK